MKANKKLVVITGASSGIGALMVNEAIRQGHYPILLARSKERLQHIQQEMKDRFAIEIPIYVTDVGNLMQVEQTFRDILAVYGAIDVLINNAGYGYFDSFLETPIDVFEQMMRVNYLGVVYCTKQVVPHMYENKRGHIINIASQAGKVATSKSTSYTATKHALLGFSNSLRRELEKENIWVSTVNPGPIKTPFFDQADKSGEYIKNVERYMLDPQQVANKVIQLINKPKRELNMPRWMELGSRLFPLFPGLSEHLMRAFIDKK